MLLLLPLVGTGGGWFCPLLKVKPGPFRWCRLLFRNDIISVIIHSFLWKLYPVIIHPLWRQHTWIDAWSGIEVSAAAPGGSFSPTSHHHTCTYTFFKWKICRISALYVNAGAGNLFCCGTWEASAGFTSTSALLFCYMDLSQLIYYY